MSHDALGQQIARYADRDGIVDTAIPRLTLVRWSHADEPVHMLQRPALPPMCKPVCKPSDGL